MPGYQHAGHNGPNRVPGRSQQTIFSNIQNLGEGEGEEEEEDRNKNDFIWKLLMFWICAAISECQGQQCHHDNYQLSCYE